jgi:hypothetical protein
LVRFLDEAVKSTQAVMPVPDQVRDDGFGIQNALELLDSGFRQNDKNTLNVIFTNPSFLARARK